MTKAKHYEQLQYDDRFAIASYQAQELSIQVMARILNRAACTISRESRKIARNAPSAKYRCTFAQQRRNRRRIHCRAQPKLHITGILFARVCQFLRRKWSPEKIALFLRRQCR